MSGVVTLFKRPSHEPHVQTLLEGNVVPWGGCSNRLDIVGASGSDDGVGRMVALLTPAQVAEELCISDRQLRKLTAKGDMPFIDIGTGKRPAPRFDPSDVQAFKAERRRISSPFSKDLARKRTVTTSGTRVPDIQELLLQRPNPKPSPSKRPSARRPRQRQSEPASQ